VRGMFTDPGHVRAADLGRVEGNVVFAYLDAFDPDRDAVEALKAHYRRGGLGDMTLKRRLEEILQALIAPIRERRARFATDVAEVVALLRDGSDRTRWTAADVVRDVRAVFALDA